MKRIIAFVKLTAQGGLLVLLPILIFVLLLIEIIDLVVIIATPIADLFPYGTFKNPEYPVLLAVILLTAASLMIGIFMSIALRSKAVVRMGQWVEKKTVGRLPLYRFVKSLVAGFLGVERDANFQPALLNAGNGQREIVYVVEELGDDELTVLVPHAPSGIAGPVKIVKKDLVVVLNASLGEANLVIAHMGLGTGRLVKIKESASGQPPAV